MREIKFRAWDRHSSMCKVHGIDKDSVYLDEGDCIQGYCIDGFIIMQSTGMKDKNGVEIFDGDELKLSDSLRGEYNEQLNLVNKFVIYNEEFMTFSVLSKQEIEWVKKGSNHFKYCHTNQENFYFLNQLDNYEVEVVGNIHEKRLNSVEIKQ